MSGDATSLYKGSHMCWTQEVQSPVCHVIITTRLTKRKGPHLPSLRWPRSLRSPLDTLRTSPPNSSHRSLSISTSTSNELEFPISFHRSIFSTARANSIASSPLQKKHFEHPGRLWISGPSPEVSDATGLLYVFGFMALVYLNVRLLVSLNWQCTESERILAFCIFVILRIELCPAHSSNAGVDVLG